MEQKVAFIGLSRAKARKILRDGKVRGKNLTKKQRRFFGAIASGERVKRSKCELCGSDATLTYESPRYVCSHNCTEQLDTHKVNDIMNVIASYIDNNHENRIKIGDLEIIWDGNEWKYNIIPFEKIIFKQGGSPRKLFIYPNATYKYYNSDKIYNIPEDKFINLIQELESQEARGVHPKSNRTGLMDITSGFNGFTKILYKDGSMKKIGGGYKILVKYLGAIFD